MRAVGGLRWVFTAFGILLCMVGLSAAVLTAAFGRPASDRLLATQALRELLRFRAMRGIEQIGGHSVASTCLDGWFRVPTRRRPIHGALVLLGDGERLYDLGKGVRRAGRAGATGPIDRARFELAGCPLFLGRHLITSLIRNLPVDVDPVRTDGARDLAIAVGPRDEPIGLLVMERSFRPVAVTLGGGVRGSSRLEPGASEATVARVRHAFDLARRPRARGV